MTIYTGNGWSISLHEGWVVEVEDNLSTIYNPEGVGALQLSSYSKDTPITEADLKELASDHLENGANFKITENDSKKVLTLALGHDGIFWQYWYIAIGSTAMLVTYNCDEVDRKKEIDSVKAMVATINAT